MTDDFPRYEKTFPGGSITLTPDSKYMGKDNMLHDSPAGVVVVVKGSRLKLTAAAVDAIVKFAQNPKAQDGLTFLREREDGGEVD